MQPIPPEILSAATKLGLHAPIVREWFNSLREGLNVSLESSPADWPDELWAVYQTLREAGEPGACGGSAKHLMDTLGFGFSEEKK